MMNEHELNWTAIRDRIRALLHDSAPLLSEDSIEFVKHQLSHDEYETALEGLCLSLTILPDASRRLVDWRECQALSRLLRLDVESVLDPDFWEKLSAAATDV